MVIVSIFVAIWIMASSVQGFYRQLGANKAGRRLSRISPSFLGMTLAHIGIGMFIIGVTLVKSYEIESDVRLDIGEQVMVGEYRFEFGGASPVDGPNYQAQRGAIQVTREGSDRGMILYPEKRVYRVQGNPMTEAGIDPGLFRDLFVALGDPLENGAWTLRIYYKPFIRWIWLGALIMAIGGFIAASDRRYRLRVRKGTTAQATATPATQAAGS